jgi:hypothetical protein
MLFPRAVDTVSQPAACSWGWRSTAAARAASLQRLAVAQLLVGVVSLLVAACSDDEPASAAKQVQRTQQEALALTCDTKNPTCFDQELQAHPQLAKLAADLTAADPALTLQAAGVLADAKGRRLVWGEYATSANPLRADARTIFASCPTATATGCSYGTATATPTGAQFLSDSGATISEITVGQPVLRKMLKAHNADKDPTLLAPLTPTHTVDAALSREMLAKVSFGQRRLVILSAFGPQVGVSTTDIESTGQNTGLFDQVQTIHFARRSDLEQVLPTLTPLDVVIVLAPGVYEKFTDKSDRPLGVAMARGIFGDELVTGKTLAKLLPAPPLGGPGLIVLAGSQTTSAKYDADKVTLAALLNEGAGRPVVGPTGPVTLAEAKSMSRKLLDLLAGGKTLQQALAAAGQPLHSPMPDALQAKWTLTGKTASFWGGAAPKTTSLKLHFLPSPPSCTDAPMSACDVGNYLAGISKSKVPATSIDNVHSTFECSPVFTGPWFECNTEAFSLRGVLSGRTKDSPYWVWVDGSAGNNLKDVVFVGEGTVTAVDQGGGSSTLRLGGIAAASPYLSGEEGWCCTAGTPLLATTKNESGSLTLQP